MKRLPLLAITFCLLSGSVVPPPPASVPTPQGVRDTVTPFAAVRPVLAFPGAPDGPLATARADAVLAPAPSVSESSTLSSGAPTRSGVWAYAKPSHGRGYLAIPEGPGWIVWVCGPLDCFERVSTDAGPELWLQRAGRIGDLSAVMFQRACGPLSAGLCRGSYAILGAADQSGEDPPRHPDDDRMRAEDAAPTLPPTDSTEGSTPWKSTP